MKYVELGRTGVRASILGMGGHEYLKIENLGDLTRTLSGARLQERFWRVLVRKTVWRF